MLVEEISDPPVLDTNGFDFVAFATACCRQQHAAVGRSASYEAVTDVVGVVVETAAGIVVSIVAIAKIIVDGFVRFVV